MTKSNVLPPGESPHDPANKEIDAVAFALERVTTMLHWIEEHRTHYELTRDSEPETAKQEWGHLVDAIQQAKKYHDRLVELVTAGYGIDAAKRPPKDLNGRSATKPGNS